MKSLLTLILLIIAATSVAADAVLLPIELELSSRQNRHSLILQRQDAAGEFLEQIRDAKFESSDEKVVRIDGNEAVPTGNGQATISARGMLDGKPVSSTTKVTVKNFDQPFNWSFRNHVESVLSKQGCNGGACHGARAGQKGFRLTLFGFDVDADYSYLTRQAVGRRIVPSDPGRSLILTKPTGTLPHKGGVRLDANSLEYRVIAEWIAAGAPPPKDNDPQIVTFDVQPRTSHQAVGNKQQLYVRALFSDGHVEDVTRWAKFTSVDATVASVDERGEVKIVGPGQGAIKVWYLNQNEIAFVVSPYQNDAPPATFAALPRRNFIDDHVNETLQQLRLPPSPRCDDATFIRRAFLDTIGVLPTAEEAQAFVSDPSADKRDRLIDSLLNRPEFVDYWSYRWSDLLLLSGERLRPAAINAYYAFIRKSVEQNKPWDQFVREIVTASGSTLENGAANFYSLHQDPEGMAETTAQAFMGLSINCAKCHNHPLEKWTNDQYYGFANLFSRVRAKGWGGDYRAGDGLRIIYSDTEGELNQPSRGKPQPPRPLDGEVVPFEATGDRREVVAKWLTSPENPYFTRTIVNRVWANFYGVGLVEAVDDMRLSNPASNAELLAAASKFLIENKYDLKSLMRAILQSETYQRDSATTAANKADERFYSRYYPRRLSAEVLLDAVSQVTAVPTEFTPGPTSGVKEPIKGKRALQLPDAEAVSYFLNAFGRPDRLTTCECERSDEPSMTQVLHLYNGDTLNGKLQAAGGSVEAAVQETDSAAIVDRVFWSALSRAPTAAERTGAAKELDATPAEERRAAVEDLFWSVLSSREFMFQH